MTDIRNLTIWQEQPPAATAHVDFRRAADTFAPAPFVSAKHYYFGFVGDLNEPVKGCYESAIASDGHLCPSVVLPGTPLPLATVHELVALFNQERPLPPRVCMCVEQYRHSIVFYDVKGDAVGEITLDTDAGFWNAQPGYYEFMQRPSWKEQVRRILREAGIGLIDSDLVRPQDRRAVSRWHAQRYEKVKLFGQEPAWSRKRTPSWTPVPKERRLRDVSELEKKRLCVWNAHYTMRGLRPTEDGHHFEKRDGTRLVTNTLLWDRCVATFPTQCDATVGEMLPCMEHVQRGDPWFMLKEGAACRPLYDCVWGVERSITPPKPTEPAPAAPSASTPSPTTNTTTDDTE